MKFQEYMTERIKLTGHESKDALIKQLQKWQKDLRVLTKAYKHIPNEDTPQAHKDFNKVRMAFGVFSRNFENWVYGSLITRDKDGEESYYVSKVRKDVWGAVISNPIFPEYYDYTKKDHVDCPQCFDKKEGVPIIVIRDDQIKKHQRFWRIAFESLQDMIDKEYDLIKTREQPTESIRIGGVNFYIDNYGRQEWHEKYLKEFFSAVRKTISLIKQRGFKNIDKDLKVFVVFDSNSPNSPGGVSKGDLTAGTYLHTKDIVTMLPFGLSKDNNTFIHELGHRFYFKSLPPNAVKSWENIIDGRKITITKEIVDSYKDNLKKVSKDDPSTLVTPSSSEMENEIKKWIEKETNPVNKEVYKFLLSATPITYLFEPEFHIDKINKNLDRHIGAKINLEFITHYGNTNAAEAFADAFRKYITKGTNALGEWTKAFFKDIVSSGGVHIKESEKRRLRIEMKNDIVKFIDLILDDGMASGATTTGDVAKNLAKGSVDVIGGKCPEGQVYDKKLKTCVQIEESSIIKGWVKGKPFGKKFDMKKHDDIAFKTMLKIGNLTRKRKHPWEYDHDDKND